MPNIGFNPFNNPSGSSRQRTNALMQQRNAGQWGQLPQDKNVQATSRQRAGARTQQVRDPQYFPKGVQEKQQANNQRYIQANMQARSQIANGQ